MIKKYKASDFKTLHDALVQYCQDIRINPAGALRIATAAYEDSGAWKFINKNKWVIERAALKKQGWDVEIILNDFEAATWALTHLKAQDLQTLKAGQGASNTLCLLGPGTGLGLGYLHKGKAAFVQKTHGGHMPITAATPEQWSVIQTLQAKVFEHIVSGPGLQKLRKSHDEKTALRLFHEFFGLFAATAVITGHAYGGLYLSGGVIENLIKAEQFDFETFARWFVLDGAVSVKRDLNAAPVFFITDPNPALKGLLHV